MKQNRIILIITLIALAVIILSGCGERESIGWDEQNELRTESYKTSFVAGYIKGAEAAADFCRGKNYTRELFNLRLTKDSLEYAKMVDKIFKK